MIVRVGVAAIFCVLCLDVFTDSANADVIYDFETLSASIGGALTDRTAFGSITLTDAAANQGAAQIVSSPLGSSVAHSFGGIDTISFQMFTGPYYALSIIDPTNLIFNISVTSNGQYLDFAGGNQRFGGFAVDTGDSDAYYALGNGDLWTIGYGSDDASSPCYGGQIPGSGTNRCMVTGEFQAVPEPSTLSILLASLVLLRLLAGPAMRCAKGVAKATSGHGRRVVAISR